MIRSLQSPNICCSFDADLVADDKIPGTQGFMGSESVYATC